MNRVEDILEKTAFQIKAEGSGMDPLVGDGDIVLCSTDAPQNGDFAVVSVDDGPAELYRLCEYPQAILLYRTGFPDPGLYFCPNELGRLRFWGRVVGVVRALPCSRRPEDSDISPDISPDADILPDTERSGCSGCV